MRCILPLVALVAVCPAATITVDQGGAGDFDTIQAGLDAAADGDTVVVKPGVYTIAVPLDFNRLHDPGVPTSPPVKNVVLRAEGGAERTTIELDVVPADWQQATLVVFRSGENAATVIAGFSLSGGKGTLIAGEAFWSEGGALLCTGGSSPTIRECTVRGNFASYGGGLCCRNGSSPVVDDSLFLDNAAETWGGAIYCQDSVPEFRGCTIAGNASRYGGGGLYCQDASPTLERCTLFGNEVEQVGGGVGCDGAASPTLTECVVEGNKAALQGGGASATDGASLLLTDCTLRGNRAGLSGSAVYSLHATCKLTNCVVAGNETPAGEGALYSRSSTADLVSCTVTGNTAQGQGGLVLRLSSVTIRDSIVWDNGGGSIESDDASSTDVAYSCVEHSPAWPGIGNIDADPRFCGWNHGGEVFVDSSHTDPGDGTPENPFSRLGGALQAVRFSLALSPGSPCVGTGEGGKSMGADQGTCEAEGQPVLLVNLGPGMYLTAELSAASLVHHVSIRGAGANLTSIEGTLSGLCTGASLSDVTVRGGNEDGGVVIGAAEAPTFSNVVITANASEMGGGVRCGREAAPVFTDCTISHNTADRGGGLYCDEDSTPRFTRCAFVDNTASSWGGGIFCADGSAPRFDDCVVRGNFARRGGGVYCGQGSSPELDACVIVKNSTDASQIGGYGGPHFIGWGGGLYAAEGATPHLAACTVAENGAGRGSAVYFRTASPLVTGCVFAANRDYDLYNSAAVLFYASSGSLSDCTVCANQGGGVLCAGSNASLVNCTIAKNVGTGVVCAGICWEAWRTVCDETGQNCWEEWYQECACPEATMLNCIVWGNQGGGILPSPGDAPALKVAYSCIEGAEVWPGEGNIALDPLFCGSDRSEVYVDNNRPGPGAGTADDPYPSIQSLAENLRFGVGLSSASPCRGSGLNGATMGADNGICEQPGSSDLVVHLAAGVYAGESFAYVNWVPGIEFRGAGQGATIVEGTIECRNGRAIFSGLTITGATAANPLTNEIGTGLAIGTGVSVQILDCAIERNAGSGVSCLGSATLRNSLIRDNGGNGLRFAGSPSTVLNCTLVDNGGCGLATEGPAVTVRNTIVWGNGSSLCGTVSAFDVAYSCLEGENVQPGAGNINLDPRFCGWDQSEVYVDSAHPAPGSGSSDDPFSGLAAAFTALRYDFALTHASPCVGSGAEGANMGADRGVRDEEPRSALLLHLAPGKYRAADLPRNGLFRDVSLYGAGQGATIIEGTLTRLRTGTSVMRLTVTKGFSGGIWIDPGQSPEIRQCAIMGNQGYGVGCDSRSFPALIGCTIMGNGSDGWGSGVYCGAASRVSMQNCLIAGNRGSQGGGVRCEEGASATLTYCTLASNQGGAVYGINNNAVQLMNCVVWSNSAPFLSVEAGGTLTVSYSCVEGGRAGVGNIATNPLFVREGIFDFSRTYCTIIDGNCCYCLPAYIVDRGDYHLQPSSPAIDAAACAPAFPADVDGTPRPSGNGCDMGAYETAEDEPPLAPPFLRGEANADGRIDIADSVCILGYLFGGPTNPCAQSVPVCLDKGDANDDGRIDIADAVKVLAYLFSQDGPLPPPFGACGVDPTADNLGCVAFIPCQP